MSSTSSRGVVVRPYTHSVTQRQTIFEEFVVPIPFGERLGPDPGFAFVVVVVDDDVTIDRRHREA